MDQKSHSSVKSRQSVRFFLEGILAMTTDEVLDALGRYTKDSKESDRQTATERVSGALFCGIGWVVGFSLRNVPSPG